MKFNFILFSCCILFSCSSKIETNPNLIDEVLFIDIIKDIHLNESKFEDNKRKRFKKYKLYKSSNFNDICSKYKITNTDFLTTMDYYIKNPKKLEKIYSNAIEKLIEEKSKNLK